MAFQDPPARRPGALRAELAVLEARAKVHEAKSETESAAACWAELARGYLFRRLRHDLAISCARRALELKDDPLLRDELATWLEGIGAWFDAARLLTVAGEPTTDSERAHHYRRVASLYWRSGHTGSAAQVLAEIARIDAECTEPLEWLAALHTNAPEIVSSERAVLAQLEAARRYLQHGARLLAFEADLRAFEIDPGSALATEQLALSLTRLGRKEAAEDVWRECAKVANDRGLYRQQVDKALGRDEHDRALAAGLDALDDTLVELEAATNASEYALNPTGPTPRTFDGVLARARQFGWLAARFEIALAEDKGLRQARPFVILTRLLASAMGRPELALESVTRGLLADPKSAELRRMLEAIATDADGSNLLLRSLVNAARVAASTDCKLWLANEFIELKNRGLDAPSLLSWAYHAKRKESLAGSIDSNTLAEWQARKAAQYEEWQTVLRDLPAQGDPRRVADLQRLATAMALDPEVLDGWRDVLIEWLAIEPSAPLALTYLAQLVDAVARKAPIEDPTPQWNAALDLLSKQGGEWGCLSVAEYWLRRGRPVDALAAARHALERAEPSQRALGWIVTLARRLMDKRLYADAMVSMAKTTESAIAAVLLAQAAEVYFELGEYALARRIVDGGLLVSPHSARLVNVEVLLQDPADPKGLSETLERALGVIPPRAQFALQLAQAHEKLGNLELSFAWALRASALRPAAAALQTQVAELAIRIGDPGRMTDWLIRAVEVPLVVSAWLPTATTVLRALTEIDAPRAAEATRRLMAALGAADSNWRTALLSCADAVADARLALEILERAVAAESDLPSVLEDIVRRRLALGDFEAAFDASLRALHAGVVPATVRSWLPNLLDVKSYEVPDTELAAAELNRELCRGDPAAFIQAARRLAFDRFVLANDAAAAFDLWLELFKSEHLDAVDWVVDDLARNLGPYAAARQLLAFCEQGLPPRQKSRLHTAFAILAAQLGDLDGSRDHVGRALAADPSNTRALFVAESVVDTEADHIWLDELYDQIALTTLGSYGERALHYRAAKIHERSNHLTRALRHACAALTALPSECTTLRLAAALTRQVGDAKPFVAAILAIVKRAQPESDAARWLSLAERELADRAEFLELRLELLLEQLASGPDGSIVLQATEAVLQLASGAPGPYASARQRLESTFRANLEHIEGPSGARLALSIGYAAAKLADRDLCCHALERSMRCDAAIDEYEGVEQTVAWLSAQPEQARDLLVRMLEILEQPYVNIGIGALKAAGYLQLYAGDTNTQTRLDALVARTGESETFLEWMTGILERTARDSEGSLPVVKQLVQLRVQQNRIADAVQLLGSLVTGHARTRVAYDCAMQAVALLLSHEHLSSAQQWIQSIREHLTPVNAATIELELARMTGETLHLVQALAHRAYSDPGSPAEGVEFLVEATDLADRLGHPNAALDCAQSAVKWDPNHAGAQLRLAAIIYKTKGPRGFEHPEETAATLRQLPANLSAQDEELRVFLLAEALDAASGLGSGMEELTRAERQLGPRPLIALGLAERLERPEDAARALLMFEQAIRGNLRGLRALSDVCIEGANLARREQRLRLALQWLEVALSEPGCPPTVSTLLEEIQQQALDEERALAEPPHVHSSSPEITISRDSVPASESDVEPATPVAIALHEPTDEEGLEIPLVRRRSDQPANSSQAPPVIDQALISPETDPESVDKAIERAAFMVSHASPSYQTLTLLRRWLRRWPSSVRLMEFVRDAAFVERDIPLSRAVEHARDVLLGLSERVVPPELSAQPIVPEAVRALLTRDIATSVNDALALLWEGAEHLLQHDLAEYGVTGVDRIGPTSTHPLGSAFAEVSTRFGLLRTPLFHRRSVQRANAFVALATPTSLLVDGELPRDFNDLVGLVAGPLWVTQPEYSLVMGAPAPQVKVVLNALRLAFGPPQAHPPSNLSDALRLAEKLWESIPSASQRRLRDLCMESLQYDRALEFARRAMHRAGLYATGDLGWSLAQLSRVEERDVMTTIADPDVGENDPSAADLLRLATSAEYAAIRWQPARGSERRIMALQR